MFNGFVESLLAAFVPFAATGLVFGLGLDIFGGFLSKLLGFGVVEAAFEFAGELGGDLVLQIEELRLWSW